MGETPARGLASAQGEDRANLLRTYFFIKVAVVDYYSGSRSREVHP